MPLNPATTRATYQGEAWKVDAIGAFDDESSSDFKVPICFGSSATTQKDPSSLMSDTCSPVKLMASKFGKQASWVGRQPSYTNASPLQRLNLFSSPSKPQKQNDEDEKSTSSSSGLSTSDNDAQELVVAIQEEEGASYRSNTSEERDDGYDAAEVEAGAMNQKTYKVWDFGKKNKNFTPPECNATTNWAATQIQRIARGGWQRLKFRVALLQHKLDTREEVTENAIDAVWDDLEERKSKYFDMIKSKEEKKNNKYITQVTTVAQEGQKIVTYLRKENRKMRSKNEKLLQDMIALKCENKSLEATQQLIQRNIAELEEHIRNFQETHDQLQEAMPFLEDRAREMKELDQYRRLICGSEHKTKVMYMKCVAEIVETMESRSHQQKLIDEIVGFCLTVDEHESNED